MALDYKSPEAADTLNDSTTAPDTLHEMATQYTNEGVPHDNVNKLVNHPNLAPATINHLNTHFEAQRANSEDKTLDNNHITLMGHPKIETHQARNFTTDNFNQIDDKGIWDQVIQRAKFAPEEKESLAHQHIQEKLKGRKSSDRPSQGFDNPPEFFLNYEEKHDDEVGNQTTETIRDVLHPYIQKELIQNPYHNDQTLDLTIDKLTQDDRGLAQLARSQKEKLSAKHIDKMIASGDDQEYVLNNLISKNLPNISQDTLISATNHQGDKSVSAKAATSPQLKTETIDQIYEGADPRIQRALLQNPNLSEDKQIHAMTKLVTEVDIQSSSIIENPNLSDKALDLAIHSNPMVQSLIMKTWSESASPPKKAVPIIISHLKDKPDGQAKFIQNLVKSGNYNTEINENFNSLSVTAQKQALSNPEIVNEHFEKFAQDNPSSAILSAGMNYLDESKKAKVMPALVAKVVSNNETDAIHYAGNNFLGSEHLPKELKQQLVDKIFEHNKGFYFSDGMIDAVNMNMLPTDILPEDYADLLTSMKRGSVAKIKNKDFLKDALSSTRVSLSKNLSVEIFSNPNLDRKTIIDHINREDIEKNYAKDALKERSVTLNLLKMSPDEDGTSYKQGLDLIKSVIASPSSTGSWVDLSNAVMSSDIPNEEKLQYFDQVADHPNSLSVIPSTSDWPKSVRQKFLQGGYDHNTELSRGTYSGEVFSRAKIEDAPLIKGYIDRNQNADSFYNLPKTIQADPEVYQTAAKYHLQNGLRGLSAHLMDDASDYHSTNWNKHLDFIAQYSDNNEEYKVDQTAQWINAQGAGLRKWTQAIDTIDYNPTIDALVSNLGSQSRSALQNLVSMGIIPFAQHEEKVIANPAYALRMAILDVDHDFSEEANAKVLTHFDSGSITPQQVLENFHYANNDSIARSFTRREEPHKLKETFIKLAQSPVSLPSYKDSFFNKIAREMPSSTFTEAFLNPEIADHVSDTFIAEQMPTFVHNQLSQMPYQQEYLEKRISGMNEYLQNKCLSKIALVNPKAMQHLIEADPTNPQTHELFITGLHRKNAPMSDLDHSNLQHLVSSWTKPQADLAESFLSAVNDNRDDDFTPNQAQNLIAAAKAYSVPMSPTSKGRIAKLLANSMTDSDKEIHGRDLLLLNIATTEPEIAIKELGKHPDLFDQVISVRFDHNNSENWCHSLFGRDDKISDSLWEKAFSEDGDEYDDIRYALLQKSNMEFPENPELKNKVIDKVFHNAPDDIPFEYAQMRPEAYIQKTLDEGSLHVLFSRFHNITDTKFINHFVDKFPEIANKWPQLQTGHDEAIKQAHDFITKAPARWREIVSQIKDYNAYDDMFMASNLMKSFNRSNYNITETDVDDLVALNPKTLFYSTRTPINSFRKYFNADDFSHITAPHDLANVFGQVEDWHQHSDLIDNYLGILEGKDLMKSNADMADTIAEVAKKFPENRRESLLDWIDENKYITGETAIVENRIGGTRGVDRLFADKKPSSILNMFSNYDGLKTSPYIKFRHVQKIIDDDVVGMGSGAFNSFIRSSSNLFDDESTNYMMNKVDWDKLDLPTANSYMMLKHINEMHFGKCFAKADDNYPKHFLPNTKFNPGYLNEKHGHRKLLSEIATTPDDFQKTVNQQALPKQFADQKGVKQLQAMLPHMGESIDYKSLKQINPAFDKMPEVKALFQKKHKVTPEDVSNKIEELNSNGYHLTFSKWTGAQRHLTGGMPNLVVQLNASSQMRQQLTEDPQRLAFYNMINRIATRIHPNNPEAGGHPNTPHIVSWVRVDTRDLKNWVVEEMQSDFTSALTSQIKTIKDSGRSSLTDEETGEEFSVEDCIKHAKDLEKIMGDWANTSISGMEEFAKGQGVENIFIHGVGLRATMSGIGSGEEGSSKLEEIYYKNPKKHDYEEVPYQSYPEINRNYDTPTMEYKGKEIPNKCWRKKLT